METAIIIVTYGRDKLTTLTLKSLFHSKLDRKKVSVTVVDNNSEPLLISTLMNHKEQIDNLVLLNSNRGKPYAWNLGASIAQEKCIANGLDKPKYFLFCDSDISFSADWYDKLLTAYKEHEQEQNLAFLGAMHWRSHEATKESLKAGKTSQIKLVKFPPGCCVLISAHRYVANGPWDTRRLIRTVDTSYYRAVLRRGYQNAEMYPKSVVSHTGLNQRTWRIDNGKPKYLV